MRREPQKAGVRSVRRLLMSEITPHKREDAMNSMLELVKHRYTAKRYDANKPISDETLNDLLEVLRLSPSSVNIQPWHFMP